MNEFISSRIQDKIDPDSHNMESPAATRSHDSGRNERQELGPGNFDGSTSPLAVEYTSHYIRRVMHRISPSERESSKGASALPQLSVSEFSAAAKPVLAKIAGVDPNDAQKLAQIHITQKQLAEAVQDHSYGAADEQVLAALYHSFAELQNLSGTDNTPTPTISVADLDQFQKNEVTYRVYVDEDHLLTSSAQHLIQEFGGKDGTITKSQIEAGIQIVETELEKELRNLGKDPTTLENDLKALGKGSNDEAKLQAVSADLDALGKDLLDHGTDPKKWDYIKSLARDQEALTIADFNWIDLEHVGIHPDKALNLAFDGNMDWHPTTVSTDAQTVLHVLEEFEEVQQIQSEFADHKLYGNTSNPMESIAFAAVQQRHIPTCEFMDVVADLAKYNPGVILNAIKQNSDGTYTVTFPGAKDDPVTVQAPTDAELGIGARINEYGMWVTILEKAYGQYCQTHKSTVHGDLGGGSLPQEGGGTAEFEMKVPISLMTGHQQTVYTFRPNMPLVTGNPTDFVPDGVNVIKSNLEPVDGDNAEQAKKDNAENMQKVAAALTDALAKGKVLTTGTDATAEDGHTDIFGQNDPDGGYYSQHAYSVLEFDPHQGPDGGTVTLRNPWGGPDGPKGLFHLSLEQFMRNFIFLEVETDKPIGSMGDLYPHK